jgi:hypothetical protein
MDKRCVGMPENDPLKESPPEERLLWRALGDLDIRVDGPVLLVQRKSGGLVFLGVSDGNDRTGQREILAGKVNGNPLRSCRATED